VHPVLRAAAIYLNDAVSSRGRQQLLLLAPRLIGTGRDRPRRLARQNAVGVTRCVVCAALPLLPLARSCCFSTPAICLMFTAAGGQTIGKMAAQYTGRRHVAWAVINDEITLGEAVMRTAS